MAFLRLTLSHASVFRPPAPDGGPFASVTVALLVPFSIAGPCSTSRTSKTPHHRQSEPPSHRTGRIVKRFHTERDPVAPLQHSYAERVPQRRKTSRE